MVPTSQGCLRKKCNNKVIALPMLANMIICIHSTILEGRIIWDLIMFQFRVLEENARKFLV